jgi:hypothetical protein
VQKRKRNAKLRKRKCGGRGGAVSSQQ